jgi:hypothetical protein
MRFRKLRIAWSVAWGLLAVLLIVWWVRSYHTYDTLTIRLSDSKHLDLGSYFGQFTSYILEPLPSRKSQYWEIIHEPLDDVDPESMRIPGVVGSLGPRQVYFPFWLPLLGLLATAAASWLPIRFKLRTLLIATTLMAVVLGLAVFATRQ